MNWHDPQQACAEYKRLDAKYGTDARSPLHHDQRCPACSPFLVVAEVNPSTEEFFRLVEGSSEGRL
jgi:hypothetical protein